MKGLEPPPSEWPAKDRRRRPTGAESEYQRQVRRFFGFLKVVLACILLVVIVTAWWVRAAVRDTATAAQEAKAAAAAAKVNSVDAKNASTDTRAILDQLRPCEPDKPASPACVAQAERDRVVADAIAQIQGQHDEVLANLASLLSRPAAQRVPSAVPAPRTRSAATSGPPTAPSATTVTTAAPPPTTTCPTKGKRPKECR